MKIGKTSVMHALIAFSEYSTFKVIQRADLEKLREYYGEDAVRKIRDSGLYTNDQEEMFLDKLYLTANLIDGMPYIITDDELREFTLKYFEDNGMWPMDKSIDEIHGYTINIAIPQFVAAGMLEIL